MYAEIEWPLELDIKGDHQYAPKSRDYPGHDFVEDESVVAATLAGVALSREDAAAIFTIVDKYPELTSKILDADWQEDG